MDNNGFINMVTSQFESQNIYGFTSFSSCISLYNDTLTSCLDAFAPLKSKVVKDVPRAPWFDEEYRDLRKKRRNAEKLWRRTKIDVHKSIFINLRNETTSLAYNKKRTYARTKINNADGSQNALYHTLKELTGQNDPPQYPDVSDTENANDFARFFLNKVTGIRENLTNVIRNSSDCSVLTDISNASTASYLDSFEPTTASEYQKL